ncbi:MAG: peptide-methionine (S)-S-oxide reductase MsrA, partial [Candidatus Aminicenantes bacterium]|nr:peptide-methionine (S)-S-oxide reductase MsrA [Candidatus Aminicenantes bacterium]
MPLGVRTEDGTLVKIDRQSDSAIFAAGCFWGVEYKFSQLKGVLSTHVGYTGGDKIFPTYREVCSKDTGHAEAVEIRYDPELITYDELMEAFFKFHDPTQVNRQGPDIGDQYRSAIFYQNDEQKDAAEKKIAELNAAGRFRKPIATQLISATEFYKAEEYHQKYYEKNRIK